MCRDKARLSIWVREGIGSPTVCWVDHDNISLPRTDLVCAQMRNTRMVKELKLQSWCLRGRNWEHLAWRREDMPLTQLYVSDSLSVLCIFHVWPYCTALSPLDNSCSSFKVLAKVAAPLGGLPWPWGWICTVRMFYNTLCFSVTALIFCFINIFISFFCIRMWVT